MPARSRSAGPPRPIPSSARSQQYVMNFGDTTLAHVDRKIFDGEVEPAGRPGDLPAELHFVEQHISTRGSPEPAPDLDPVEHRLDIHLPGRGGVGTQKRKDIVGAVGPLVDIP